MSGVRFALAGRARLLARHRRLRAARAPALLLIGPSGSGKSTFLSLLVRHRGAAVGAASRCSAPTSTQLSDAGARSLPRRALRHHLPDVQPAALRLGHRQRAAAAELRAATARARHAQRLAPRTRPCGCCNALGLDAASSRRALGGQPERRPAAARRGGAGADRRAGADRGRRADLGARSRSAGRLPRSAVRARRRRPARR